MKFFIPMLAVCCFALAGCHATSSCCGKCSGDASKTACPADCTKPCCAKK